MATIMFAAPVQDLRKAIERGSLGSLNPFPWVAMTGNCLGWCAYGYYKSDPFVLGGNLPAFVLSIWLNSGAAKLQFLQKWIQHKEQLQLQQQQITTTTTTTTTADLVTVPQERNLLIFLFLWAVVLVYVEWFPQLLLFTSDPSVIIGVLVNFNLVFFYGAPLEAIQRVVSSGKSDAIHLPTQIMTCTNTTFWALYGFAKHDPVIYIPNVMGLLLGIVQGLLRCIYPATQQQQQQQQQHMILNGEDEDDDDGNDGEEENIHAHSLLT